MNRCKLCKKRIKWIQVPVDDAGGTVMKWLAFQPRIKPYRRHECPPAKPAIEAPRVAEGEEEEKWWQK